METQIKASLVSLLAAIQATDGKTVASEMARLDEALARGRDALHPQLAHFLGNRSYAKALMFLGGETNIPVGACGGRAHSTHSTGSRQASSGQAGKAQS